VPALKYQVSEKMNRLIIVLTAFLLYPTEAHAYIDPGSGSAIISMIIGVFVAIGLTVKSFWYKITGIFRRDKSDNDTP